MVGVIDEDVTDDPAQVARARRAVQAEACLTAMGLDRQSFCRRRRVAWVDELHPALQDSVSAIHRDEDSTVLAEVDRAYGHEVVWLWSLSEDGHVLCTRWCDQPGVSFAGWLGHDPAQGPPPTLGRGPTGSLGVRAPPDPRWRVHEVDRSEGPLEDAVVAHRADQARITDAPWVVLRPEDRGALGARIEATWGSDAAAGSGGWVSAQDILAAAPAEAADGMVDVNGPAVQPSHPCLALADAGWRCVGAVPWGGESAGLARWPWRRGRSLQAEAWVRPDGEAMAVVVDGAADRFVSMASRRRDGTIVETRSLPDPGPNRWFPWGSPLGVAAYRLSEVWPSVRRLAVRSHPAQGLEVQHVRGADAVLAHHEARLDEGSGVPWDGRVDGVLATMAGKRPTYPVRAVGLLSFGLFGVVVLASEAWFGRGAVSLGVFLGVTAVWAPAMDPIEPGRFRAWWYAGLALVVLPLAGAGGASVGVTLGASVVAWAVGMLGLAAVLKVHEARLAAGEI